jgi:RNA polymerase sigma factor (sigma-70 family)
MAKSLTGAAVRQLGRLFDTGTIAGLTDSELLERFVNLRDEVAFEAIVSRHGPMVLGVCRAILKNGDEVEDTFQAAFLILIRRAETIRGRESLGGWLHRVAYRVAIQSRAEAARRRSAEAKAAEFTPRTMVDGTDETVDELRSIVHEEIARLPDRFRLPVVLCDLHGLSRPEAARRLNWSEGAFCSRLTRARARLRDRLTRRGLAVAIGGLTSMFEREARATVPRVWVESLARAASIIAPGDTVAAGIVSATAARLASITIKAMAASQLKGIAAAGVTVLAFGLVASHTIPAGFVRAGENEPPSKVVAEPKPIAKPASSEESSVQTRPITFRGQVLDPDGKPFAGAKLVVSSPILKEPSKLPTRAASGADGRFEFKVPVADFDGRFAAVEGSMVSSVLAIADGFAFGFAEHSGEDLTLHLARDDMPIEGRIVDLQGQPVAGASVAVYCIKAAEDRKLDAWLRMIEEQHSFYLGDDSPLTHALILRSGSALIAPTRSDTDGRFVIPGVGRERLVELLVEGSTIETSQLFVRTRPGETKRFPKSRGRKAKEQITLHGATFVHVAGATRPIEGIVRDRETGRPLAGITIFADQLIGDRGERPFTRTDAQGHYRINGMPRDGKLDLVAMTLDERPSYATAKMDAWLPFKETVPYLFSRLGVPRGDGRETGPIHVDFELDPGVWVTGRVLDKATGKPVMGGVVYLVKDDNPALKRLRGRDYSPIMSISHVTQPDGSFRLIAFPGRGYLTVQTMDRRYIFGVGADSIRKDLENGTIECQPMVLVPWMFNAVAAIDPAGGTTEQKKDLLLERGRAVELCVLDPDGRPLSGLSIAGLRGGAKFPEDQDAKANTFTVDGLIPGETRRVTVRQNAKHLIGQIVINSDAKESVSLTLQPWATVAGRIINAEREPAEGGTLRTQSFNLEDNIVYGMDTKDVGRDGKFRIEGLIPGRPFTFETGYSPNIPQGVVFRDLILKPGETRNLGDIIPMPTKKP